MARRAMAAAGGIPANRSHAGAAGLARAVASELEPGEDEHSQANCAICEAALLGMGRVREDVHVRLIFLGGPSSDQQCVPWLDRSHSQVGQQRLIGIGEQDSPRKNGFCAQHILIRGVARVRPRLVYPAARWLANFYEPVGNVACDACLTSWALMMSVLRDGGLVLRTPCAPALAHVLRADHSYSGHRMYASLGVDRRSQPVFL